MVGKESEQDIILVRNAIAGDKSAYAALFDRHFSVLHTLAISIIHDRDKVQDILQEGFIQIFQHLDSLKNPAKFRSWAYTIIKRKCLLALKKIHAEPMPISAFPEADIAQVDQLVQKGDPRSIAEQQERFKLIQQAIFRLPMKYREVAVLFFLEEMEYPDIAKSLGISLYCAEKRLLRGKAMLRKLLKEIL